MTWAHSLQTDTKSQEAKIASPENSKLPDITSREVKVAIKDIKKNKTPGTDEISRDIFEEGGDEVITHLVKLFNQIIAKMHPTILEGSKDYSSPQDRQKTSRITEQ